MVVAVISVAFLFIATILGLFLAPTVAEIEARNFKPPTASHDDDAGHGHADSYAAHGH